VYCRYYMGGNGPHNGPRNTSLGLATLRPDGFGGIAGSGVAITVPVKVTGATLIVTADMLSPGSGMVRVGVVAGTPGGDGLDAQSATPLTANVTDQGVVYRGGKSFATLIGKEVALEIWATRAMVYTVGFEAAEPLLV
jgi:hypothetical protein